MVKMVRRVLRGWRTRRQTDVARKLRYARKHHESATLTRDEFRVVFDRMAQRELHMSGDEFLARLDSGTLPDTPAAAHLAVLAGGPRAR